MAHLYHATIQVQRIVTHGEHGIGAGTRLYRGRLQIHAMHCRRRVQQLAQLAAQLVRLECLRQNSTAFQQTCGQHAKAVNMQACSRQCYCMLEPEPRL